MRKELLASLLSLTTAAVGLGADEKVKPQTPAPPAIMLLDRHGHATPLRAGFQHTGAGNIDLAQPAPDTVVITMTGVAVAGPHPCKDSAASMDFDLSQGFEITLDKPEVRKVTLTVDARVIGLLRSEAKGRGSAEESGAVTIGGGPVQAVELAVPSHAVACGESLSINDHAAPVTVVVPPGRYTLHQSFHVGVSHAHALCGKAWSAEFAPDPALDPLWISYFEPFHGANKKDFGFQVTVKVSAE